MVQAVRVRDHTSPEERRNELACGNANVARKGSTSAKHHRGSVQDQHEGPSEGKNVTRTQVC